MLSAGEVEVAFVDETGVAQAHPNRSVWTRIGECHSLDVILDNASIHKAQTY